MFVDFFGDESMNIDSSEENMTINNISVIPQNNFNNNIIKNKKILNEDWNNELNQIKIKAIKNFNIEDIDRQVKSHIQKKYDNIPKKISFRNDIVYF